MLHAGALNFYSMDCTTLPHTSVDVKIEEEIAALTATPRPPPVSHPLASTSLSNATAPIRPTYRARSHSLAVSSSSRHPHHPYLPSNRDAQPLFYESIPSSVLASMSGPPPYAAWPRTAKDESNAGYIDAQPSGLVRRSSHGDRYPPQVVYGMYAQVRP